MLQDPKHKKAFIIGYIIFLVLGVFYVNGIVGDKSVEVGEKNTDKENTEVKETNIKVVIQTGNQIQEYPYKGKNLDSIMDVFESLRSNTDFKYQLMEYTYGPEIDSINGIKSSATEKWRVYDGQKDITNDLHEMKIEDLRTYTITRNAMPQ